MKEIDALRLGLLRSEDAPEEKWYQLTEFEGEEFEHKRGKLRVVHTDNWVWWALLEWACSDGDGTNERYNVLCYGEGTGFLREPRHTHFGEEGYVFYIDAELLKWGFEKLKKYFDFE